MKTLSKNEKEKILLRLFWDKNTELTDVDKLLAGKLEAMDDINSRIFFARLLASCDWYTLLKLLPPTQLKRILDDDVLDNIYPKDLKGKYLYARDVLSRHVIPLSR